MNPSTGPFDLISTYLRLRSDASIEPLTVDEGFWQRISSGGLGSFHNEYLVSAFTFDADWPSWEMHPNGDEIVCLVSGAATFVLQIANAEKEITLDSACASASSRRG